MIAPSPQPRKGGIWLVGLIVIVFVVGLIESGLPRAVADLVRTISAQNPTSEDSVAHAATRVEVPLAVSGLITHADYDTVRTGMTYEQVCSIIGSVGVELSRSDIGSYTTVMYSWKNRNGSNMNAMFQNGLLVTKAQFGLP
jgi:hypothetical protein